MRRTDWTLKWEWPLWLVEFVNLQNYMMFLKAEQLVMWNNVKQKHVSPRRCGPGCDVNYHPCKWNMYKYICLSMQSMRLAPILRGTPCHLHSRCQDRPQAHHHLKAGAAVPTYLFFVMLSFLFIFQCVQMSCSPTIGSWFTSRELQHSDPPARPRKGLWSWHGQEELHMRRRSQWFQHQLLAAQFHLAWLVDPLKAPAVYGHFFGYLQNWGNLAKSNPSL